MKIAQPSISNIGKEALSLLEEEEALAESDDTYCTVLLMHTIHKLDNGNTTDTDNDDDPDDQYLVCEKPNGTIYKINTPDHLDLLEKFRSGEYESGVDVLMLTEDIIINNSKAEITSSVPLVFVKKKDQRGLGRGSDQSGRGSSGYRSVLAVRVIRKYARSTASEEEISNSIFGNGKDPVNLVSQYGACSHNKLRFVKPPYRRGLTKSIVNGVVTIAVPYNTYGRLAYENAITSELNRQFGVTNPNQLADHVMYVLPPNSMGYAAYAYYNHWCTIYDGNWCLSVSTQMHGKNYFLIYY